MVREAPAVDAWGEECAGPPAAEPGSTLTAALDLGPLAAPRAIADTVDGAGDAADFYKFQLATDRRVAFRLDRATRTTSVDVIADRDANSSVGLFEVLASSSATSTADGFAVEELSAGTYYVRVRPSTAGEATGYDLRIEPLEALPPDVSDDPGAAATIAADLGTLTTDRSVRQTIGGIDRSDLYRFTLDANAQVQVTLSGLSERVEIGLFADRDGNGSFGTFSRRWGS